MTVCRSCRQSGRGTAVSTTGTSQWSPKGAVLRASESAPASLVRVATELVHDFRRLEPFDRAMTLAAQAFTSIFPLVMTTLAVVGDRGAEALGEHLQNALALPPSTTSALVDAQADGTTGQAATFGVLSLLIVLLSATSLSRALTRVYAKAWGVRVPGWSTGWRWIAAVVGIAACTVLLQAVQHPASGDELATTGALVLTLVGNALLWTWVPWLLLARQVTVRKLLPGGVLMGAASVALYFASRLYMPRALDHADDKYGELGVAFTFIGWLFCVAFVLIVTTALGRAVAGRNADGPPVQDREAVARVPGAQS